MQPRLPFDVVDAPVVFVRHRRARRYILRMLGDGTLRVTLPRWGAKREAEAFVKQSRAWIEKQQQLRRDAPRSEPWCDGSTVLIDGVPMRLSVEATAQGIHVRCGDILVPTRSRTGGADVRGIVHRWLRARAVEELPPLLYRYAEELGIVVTRVSVRDQRSRWGSCSRQGAITLNWRLLQMPSFVRDYIVIHELMHRREMNHSPRFWRHVAAACPLYLDARKWLRTEGKHLL
jgi:predicted metal-dependent hydrolase